MFESSNALFHGCIFSCFAVKRRWRPLPAAAATGSVVTANSADEDAA